MRATISLSFVALLVTIALPPAPADAPEPVPTRHADLFGGSSDGPAVPPVRHTYLLATAGLADAVAETGRLRVSLGEGVEVELALQERDIFVPGQKKVRYLDDDGRVLREEPILARTFLGRVVETGERAQMTIAPEGLYGALFFHGTEYSFQPRSWEGGLVTQEVVHDVASTLPADLVRRAGPDPLLAAAEASSATGYRRIYIHPVAEPSFRAWASNWGNRIVNAYFYAEVMWNDETGITQLVWSPAAPNQDFYSQTGSGSDCGSMDLGLDAFEGWIWPNGFNQVNAYGLWHGADGAPDLFGCANGNCDGTPSGCLQPYGAMPRSVAAHVVQAKDLFSTDNYDATRSDHLGKAAAHELTHNAGEPDHPSDGYCWQPGLRNLMKPSAPMGCKGTWRVQTSRDRVLAYAPPYLTG